MLYFSQTALKVDAESLRNWYPEYGRYKRSVYTRGDNTEEDMNSYDNGMVDSRAVKRAVRLMRLG
uniref:Uncharacterized protein n=1 Tax=Trichobilharzia regenti TaxID=157069 RepID=A0AA85IL67_TRIRE|nr:unnamed protein product [Trichobilharzia regenti]